MASDTLALLATTMPSNDHTPVKTPLPTNIQNTGGHNNDDKIDDDDSNDDDNDDSKHVAMGTGVGGSIFILLMIVVPVIVIAMIKLAGCITIDIYLMII